MAPAGHTKREGHDAGGAESEQRNEKRMLKVLYTGTLVLLLILLVFIYSTLERYDHANQEIRRHNMALHHLYQELSALKDAEIGCRGFLLTQDPDYLIPYRVADDEVDNHCNMLDSLLVGPANTTRTNAMRVQAHDLLRVLGDILQRDTSGTLGEADLVGELAQSKRLMDNIRERNAAFVNDLRASRDTHMVEVRTFSWSAPLMLVLYAALAILATGLLFWRSFRSLTKAEKAESELAKKVVQLDREVRTREFAEGSLRQVLDSSPSGIVALRSVRNEDGDIVDLEFLLVNDQAERLTGRGHAELIGRRLLAVMPEDLLAGFFTDYVRVVETGRPFVVERHYAPNGTDLWLALHAVRLQDGLVVTFTDITKRMQAEELSQEADRLALTDRIARTLAHEVRNPLTNVHLALEQLQEEMTAEHDGARPLFDIVERNIKRIGQLITEMLESSRKRELQLKPCRVEDLVRTAMRHVHDRLALKNMRGETTVEPDLPEVLADKDVLNLAITNLAVNAVEAMQPGVGVLRIAAHRVGDDVVIKVQDNGKGIAPENIGRLFEAFYTERAGGMGLGLTAARSIFNGHGVYMDVESELGKGTTFALLFTPVRRGPERAEA